MPHPAPDLERYGVPIYLRASGDSVIVTAGGALDLLMGDGDDVWGGSNRILNAPWTWFWSMERRVNRQIDLSAKKYLRRKAAQRKAEDVVARLAPSPPPTRPNPSGIPLGKAEYIRKGP